MKINGRQLPDGKIEMRTGFTQKRCPKCGGNVFLEKDSGGWYEQCLQCCRIWYLQTIIDAGGKARNPDTLRVKDYNTEITESDKVIFRKVKFGPDGE